MSPVLVVLASPCFEGLFELSPNLRIKSAMESTTLQPEQVIPGQVPDPAYLPKYMLADADKYLNRLLNELDWKDKYWQMIYKLPQKVFHYKLSHREKNPIPLLEELIRFVEHLHNAKASEAWCNLFRNGDDRIDWHQDQYKEHLTTLSFGSSRKFQMRQLDTGEISEITLKHGDVYSWSPETDKKYEHCIPAAPGEDGVRVSIVVWTQPPGSRQ